VARKASTLNLEKTAMPDNVSQLGADQRQDVYSRSRMDAFCNSPSLVKPACRSTSSHASVAAPGYAEADCSPCAASRTSSSMADAASPHPRQQRSERLMLSSRRWMLAGPNYHIGDIGIALYGDARVERDWMHPGDNLRDPRTPRHSLRPRF